MKIYTLFLFAVAVEVSLQYFGVAASQCANFTDLKQSTIAERNVSLSFKIVNNCPMTSVRMFTASVWKQHPPFTTICQAFVTPRGSCSTTPGCSCDDQGTFHVTRKLDDDKPEVWWLNGKITNDEQFTTQHQVWVNRPTIPISTTLAQSSTVSPAKKMRRTPIKPQPNLVTTSSKVREFDPTKATTATALTEKNMTLTEDLMTLAYSTPIPLTLEARTFGDTVASTAPVPSEAFSFTDSLDVRSIAFGSVSATLVLIVFIVCILYCRARRKNTGLRRMFKAANLKVSFRRRSRSTRPRDSRPSTATSSGTYQEIPEEGTPETHSRKSAAARNTYQEIPEGNPKIQSNPKTQSNPKIQSRKSIAVSGTYQEIPEEGKPETHSSRNAAASSTYQEIPEDCNSKASRKSIATSGAYQEIPESNPKIQSRKSLAASGAYQDIPEGNPETQSRKSIATSGTYQEIPEANPEIQSHKSPAAINTYQEIPEGNPCKSIATCGTSQEIPEEGNPGTYRRSTAISNVYQDMGGGKAKANPQQGEPEAMPKRGSPEANRQSTVISNVYQEMGEGKPEAVPKRGKPETMPRQGKPETMPRQGKPETMPRQGKPETMPRRGKPEAIPRRGKPETLPRRGKAEGSRQGTATNDMYQGTPEEGNQKAIPERSDPEAPAQSSNEFCDVTSYDDGGYMPHDPALVVGKARVSLEDSYMLHPVYKS